MYLTWDEQTIENYSSKNIDTMYNRGFVFTRPSEGLMQQTRSVRVDLSKFELSSENRRILRKTDGLQITNHKLPITNYHWTIGKLAKDFYTTKFGDGTFSANKIKELLTSGRKDFNRLFQYTVSSRGISDTNDVAISSEKIASSSTTPRNDTDPIGYCIAVETPDILHYSYPFYNLETAPKDMGLGMMTRAIIWAKENGKKYIYLGSAQRESDTYKFQFSGIEVFEQHRGWGLVTRD